MINTEKRQPETQIQTLPAELSANPLFSVHSSGCKWVGSGYILCKSNLARLMWIFPKSKLTDPTQFGSDQFRVKFGLNFNAQGSTN